MTLELFLIIFFSILNLMGLNTSISTIFLFIFNIILYFIISFTNAKKSKLRGILTGLATGLFLSTIMILLNISFFKGNFNINQVLYIIILNLTSIFGGITGKAKQIEK